MIDLNHLEKYKENNRIEAKKALGGLPHSIWETYSAFANTLGGIILLGVQEEKDKTLHAVDLPDPEGMKKEFWRLVNDPKKASINILSAKDVCIETVNGNHIIVISVPGAERSCKPVYVDGNPLNTYRRNGEGDYKCTQEEYQSMVRDAAVKSQDMLILEDMGTNVFNADSVRRYRQRMKSSHPGHVWETLEDDDFLIKMGAAAIGEDENIHPTAGGLLMFGNENDIVRVFPHYSLEYREESSDKVRRTDRIDSSSGDWSGNVLDFFFWVYYKLQMDKKLLVKMRDGFRVNDSPVHMALREALANCLINADYYGRGGIVVIKNNDSIRFSNPGTFRIEIDAAISGGTSDPRNSAIQKLFNMIDIGERTGSGIPNIFRVWKEQNWQEPDIIRATEPDRTTLVLHLSPAGDAEKPKGKTGNTEKHAVKKIKRQMIIDYLTDHVEASTAELSSWLGLSSSSVSVYLRELISDDIVVPAGGKRDRVYKLKS